MKRRCKTFSEKSEKETCYYLVLSSVIVLFFMLTMLCWQESRDNKEYTVRLEGKIAEYEQKIAELEKDLSDSKRDMENIVRCVLTGEWEKDVRNE